MNITTARTIASAVAILFAIPLLLRADSSPTPEKLVYVPPAGVAVKTRVKVVPGRSGEAFPKDFAMVILCPEHTGRTVQEHPSIFWYMNTPLTGRKCRLSITTEGEPEPLFETDVDAGKAVGIQRIDLKDLSKALLPNTDYRISATILNAKNHSDDLSTSGHILRIAAPEKLVSKLLARPTPGERAIVYAQQGIWYDALSAISDQIAAEPDNKALHRERADLLKNVELPEAAAFDEQLVAK